MSNQLRHFRLVCDRLATTFLAYASMVARSDSGLRLIYRSRISLVGILATLAMSLLAPHATVRARTVPEGLSPEMLSAVELALEHYTAESGTNHPWAVVSAKIDGDWALATVMPTDLDAEESLSEARLSLLRYVAGKWTAEIEGSARFVALSHQTPDAFIGPESKLVLDPSQATTPSYASMRWPWDKTQTWYLTQGWHGTNGLAIDVGPAGSNPNKWALAAHDGMVTRVCVSSSGPSASLTVRHSDGTTTGYVHLDKTTVPENILGIYVSQGTYLGSLVTGSFSDDCGYSTGPHIHFQLPSRTMTIDGWSSNASNNCWTDGSSTKCPSTSSAFAPSTNTRLVYQPTNPGDVFVDDGDSGFTSSAGWTLATAWTRSCTGYSGDARWTKSRNPSYSDIVDWAKWTPSLNTSGKYEVFVSFPGISNNSADTTSARYVVKHRLGTNTVTLSQAGNWCSWWSLGIYDFDAGSTGYVYLGDYTGGENPQTAIAADVVLFRRVGDIVNVPPNPPQLVSPANGTQTASSSVILYLQDAGDPDNYPRNYRDYIYYMERTDGSLRQESGWTTNTAWTFSFPGVGSYRWWAVSGDGAVASASSEVRLLDYVDPSTPTSTATPTRTPTATPTRTPTPTPTRTPMARTVMIEAGHGVNGSTGSMSCDGLHAESDNTWAVANFAADYLRQRNLTVLVVRSDDPAMPQFAGTAFVSLHNDFCAAGASGYKTSRYGGVPVTGQNGSNDGSDQLVASIWNTYGTFTGLSQDRAAGHFTTDMLYYFGLNPANPKGISAQTPGAIIEMGWWSGDEYALLYRRQELGLGVAQSILAFLGEPLIATATPTATMTATPLITPTRTPTTTPTPTPTQSNPSGTKLSVLPMPVQAMLGVPVTVSIGMSNVTNLGAFDFTLMFDPNVVTVEGVSLGAFGNSTGRTFMPVGPAIDNAAGTVAYGAFSLGDAPAGASGSGTIAYLRLMPVHTGTSTINFVASGIASVTNSPITHTAVGSVVNVTASCRWDSDGDGDIDIFDVQEVARRWNSHPGQALYDSRFDFDSDGDIDIFDVQAVASRWNRRCSDLPSLPAQMVAPPEFVTPGTKTDAVADFKVDPTTTDVRQGDLFTVSVTISNVVDLGAFEFGLEFNPTLVQVDGVQLGEFPAASGRTVVALGPTIDNGVGAIVFGAVSLGATPPGPTGGGSLAQIRLRAMSTGTSPLAMTSAKYATVENVQQTVAFSSGSVTVFGAARAFLPIISR